MTSYDKLRSIGASVETADALAPVLDGLSPKKREAFYLWSMGMTYREVGDILGCSKQYIHKIIKMIKWLTGACKNIAI